MNVLMIAAHGSRKKTSNAEVADLARRLGDSLASRFDRVEHAFLQFAEPLLEDRLDALARDGAGRIVLFPFFIAAGSHITEDIPALVEKIKGRFPDVQIVVTRHLGALDAIDSVISDAACQV